MLERGSTSWSIICILTSVKEAVGIVASLLVVVFLGLTVRAILTIISLRSTYAIELLPSYLSFAFQFVSTILILAPWGIEGLFQSFLVQFD